MTIHNLTPIEREVIKLINHFSKRAEKLIKEGKLSPEHQQVSESCQRLVTQIYEHAEAREAVLLKRENLNKIVQDNASCPKCNKTSHLKLVGVAIHEKGWKSNNYKCRRCNIQFTWNRPNNPWDMLLFMQNYQEELQTNASNEQLPDDIRQHSRMVLEQLNQNINQLQPVLQQSDQEISEINQRDHEMAKMLTGIKSHLLIEKIKMDTLQLD